MVIRNRWNENTSSNINNENNRSLYDPPPKKKISQIIHLLSKKKSFNLQIIDLIPK